MASPRQLPTKRQAAEPREQDQDKYHGGHSSSFACGFHQLSYMQALQQSNSSAQLHTWVISVPHTGHSRGSSSA
jgi:hypothetical protein